MSRDIRAIVVVPAVDDPGGLLTNGPLGAFPPIVYNVPGRGWGGSGDPQAVGVELGLPVVWNGHPIPDAVFRLLWVQRNGGLVALPWVIDLLFPLSWAENLLPDAPGQLKGKGWARRVDVLTLDAHGRLVVTP